jgi:ATP-dependent RNA helicase DeaD
VDQETKSFRQFNFCPEIERSIEDSGYTQPTDIQEAVIPHIIEGRDVIAKAQTGSGKTAAFCLPALHLMTKNPDMMMLIITPTRELALQVCDEMKRFSKHLKIAPCPIYGGEAVSNQIARLKRDNRIIVGTPGRLLDMFESGNLKKFTPSLVILDEADEMLNMGFIEDIESILGFVNEKRQTLLFSATLSAEIKKISKRFLVDPIFTDKSATESNHEDIHQVYYMVPEKQRREALVQLIHFHNPKKSIVFCNTKKQVAELAEDLMSNGIPVLTLHGDMSQRDRQNSIDIFRKSESKTLIATDVAGRGINVTDVTHVFNYDLPFSVECYTHRIGRTGRMGNKGTAITLIAPKQKYILQNFAKAKLASIKLSELPTESDMKYRQQKRFADSINEEAIHTDANNLLADLQKEFDLKDITLKLISRYLKKEGASKARVVASPKEDQETRFGGGDRKRSFGRDNRNGPRKEGKGGGGGRPPFRNKRGRG